MQKLSTIIVALLMLLFTHVEASAADCTKADALMKKAKAAELAKKPDECIKLLQSASKLCPNSANIYFNLATVYARDKSADATALPLITKAVALKPNDCEFRITRALILQGLKRYTAADRELEEAARVAKSAKERQLIEHAKADIKAERSVR